MVWYVNYISVKKFLSMIFGICNRSTSASSLQWLIFKHKMCFWQKYDSRHRLTYFTKKEFVVDHRCGSIFVLFCFVLSFWLHYTACGILVPKPGLNLAPWQGKCGVLTTGPPGSPELLTLEREVWKLSLFQLFFFLNYVAATSQFHWKVKTSIVTLTFSNSSKHRNDGWHGLSNLLVGTLSVRFFKLWYINF